MPEAEERRVIARSVEAIAKTAGTPPVGWHTRSATSPNTRRLLIEHGGFLYDSNAYNDDMPWIASDRRIAISLSCPMPSIRMTCVFSPAVASSRVMTFARYCIAALDRLLLEGSEAPRMMSVGLHLRIIGRPARIGGLEAFLAHAARQPGVWFARRDEIAHAWRRRHRPRSPGCRGRRFPGSMTTMTRILILNPNMTEAVTERLVSAAAGVVAPTGTTLIPLTAPRGVPYISSRADAVIGSAVALEMLSENHAKADAVVIAAFGDPGLGAARELFDIPVVGMAEAAMLTACMLGRTFAIVTFSDGLVAWYNECLDWNGLRGRCAGIFALNSPFRSLADVQDEKEQALAELVRQVVANHGADVVILAGAPLSGLADKLLRQGAGSARRRHPGRGEAGRGAGCPATAQGNGRDIQAPARQGLRRCF